MILDLLLGLLALVTLVVACAVEVKTVRKIVRSGGRARWPILY